MASARNDSRRRRAPGLGAVAAVVLLAVVVAAPPTPVTRTASSTLNTESPVASQPSGPAVGVSLLAAAEAATTAPSTAAAGTSGSAAAATPTSTPPAPTPAPATPSPATPTATPKPVDPLATLSKARRAKFKACLGRAVAPGWTGNCAKLLQQELKKAGFHPWAAIGRITVPAANAILNYQRSRGLTASGKATRATWLALATRAPAVPKVLPKKCFGKGVVLCVDQAHRRLFWLRNGKVVKTFKVRLGGYNSHAKTKKWRNFPTANGTWKVYDKQVDPFSENYGYGAMPYSTMFYPDMYVHYSPGFASVGYAGSSHGCVNIGRLSEARWIFKHTPIGARVHIFSPKVAG